ncbi:luciferase domain-containing protein [Pedobacter changchengzhani]|uniref:luciferase domain-containing protein n=1 Tax=Pedobacter changchengzhani TaxID=2529274 RepID=UPI0014050BCA|nr:luciferase family protein [Pedobacter changchengzhani]
MIFSFVVKRLGFIKSIPLTALIFDSGLKLWLFISKSEKLDWFDDLEEEILNWNGVTISLHKFGGTQFNYGKHEIGHLHSNGILDILFDKKTKAELIATGKAKAHHVFNNSGWISFYIEKKDDLPDAISLLRMRYDKIVSKTMITSKALLQEFPIFDATL